MSDAIYTYVVSLQADAAMIINKKHLAYTGVIRSLQGGPMLTLRAAAAAAAAAPPRQPAAAAVPDHNRSQRVTTGRNRSGADGTSEPPTTPQPLM